MRNFTHHFLIIIILNSSALCAKFEPWTVAVFDVQSDVVIIRLILSHLKNLYYLKVFKFLRP
jgi:hypothetical protein